MEYFSRERVGRYYVFERNLDQYESMIVQLPLIVYKNVNFDMGVAASGDEVSFYVTYSLYPDRKTAVWKKFDSFVSNKSVRAIKIINNSYKKQSICIRIAF